MNKEEITLIKKCIKGDAKSQKTLYTKYKVKWFMVCLRYARDRSEAEDMLQEGLINIFKDLKQYNPKKGYFSTWSNRVLVNSILQFLRKWKKIKFDIDITDMKDILPSSDDIYATLGAKELTQMIQQLPLGYRVVFNMYVIEGFKHKEIAEKLKISENTSKSQLFKAKRMLRNQLEDILQN